MITYIPIKYITRFVLLIAVQILVLNHLLIGGYVNPYIYVIFILLLPFEIKGWILLLSSFLLGFTIDMFSNSPGMHTSACLFMAFTRPWIISMISPKTNYEPDTEPRINNMGALWIAVYSSILVFLHHFILFFLEVFRFEEIFDILLRTIISTIASVFIIMLVHFLTNKPDQVRSRHR